VDRARAAARREPLGSGRLDLCRKVGGPGAWSLGVLLAGGHTGAAQQAATLNLPLGCWPWPREEISFPLNGFRPRRPGSLCVGFPFSPCGSSPQADPHRKEGVCMGRRLQGGGGQSSREDPASNQSRPEDPGMGSTRDRVRNPEEHPSLWGALPHKLGSHGWPLKTRGGRAGGSNAHWLECPNPLPIVPTTAAGLQGEKPLADRRM